MSKKNITKINWSEVDAVPEDKYNYDDAPEITSDMFKNMSILMPDDTKKINIRIKNSTIEFFKKNSKHYQTLINSVLDAYVDSCQKKVI